MNWLKDLIQRMYHFVVYLFTTSPSEWSDDVVTELGLALILAIAGALLVAFRKGVLGVFGRLVTLMRSPQTFPEPTITDEQAQVQRGNMIAVVRQSIEQVLRSSLHGQVLLLLGVREKPDAIAYPWDTGVQRPSAVPKDADISQIVQLFDDFAGAMLILGERGSGKTITLLELGRQLLDRAQKNPSQPVPVIFRLSTWAVEKQPLDEWLVQELERLYFVPPALGRYWVSRRAILPLLDGLDEVWEDARNECLNAIKAYHDVRSKWVVCSGLVAYESLSERLHAGGAICIQALRDRDVAGYLSKLHKHDLEVMIAADPDLKELARTPLMLSVMVDASEEMTPLGSTLTPEQKRGRIFDAYVRRVLLKHGSKLHRWPPGRMLRWLRWLGRELCRRDLQAFAFTDMQPDWLPDPRARQRYYSLVRLGIRGLTLGVFVLGVGMVLGLVFGPVFGLVCGVTGGVIGGRVLIGFLDYQSIRLSIHLEWHWQESRAALLSGLRQWGSPWVLGCLLLGIIIGTPVGLVLGMPGGIVFGLTGGLVLALFGGLGVGLVLGLRSGLQESALMLPVAFPDDVVWRSGRNGLLVGLSTGVARGLIAALGLGLFGWVLGGLFGGWDSALIFGILSGLIGGLFSGLFGGLSGGLSFGGLACLEHWLLRFLLWRYDCIPPPNQVVSWLNEATDRNLLNCTGHTYLFIHWMLMKHVAELSDDFLHDLDQEYQQSGRATSS